MTRKEAAILAQFRSLLALGHQCETAIWEATNKGLDMDASRLLLLHAEQPQEAAPARKPLSQVTRGEYVRLTPTGPVWVRGDYCRASREFELQRADDINRFAYRKGTALVYVGFTY